MATHFCQVPLQPYGALLLARFVPDRSSSGLLIRRSGCCGPGYGPGRWSGCEILSPTCVHKQVFVVPPALRGGRVGEGHPRPVAGLTGPLAWLLVGSTGNVFNGGRPEGGSEYDWHVLLKAEGAHEAVTEDPQQADREVRQQRLSEELDRLRDMQEASEGSKILARNHALAASYRVFRGNHRELRGFLDHIAAPTVDAHMWAERHRYRLDYAFDEVARLLHNYVSAVFSLVEATRRFRRKYYADSDFIEEYDKWIKED